ncbi:MAG: hypothetical protein WBQ21_07440 [Solirubrobacteraceae bacterium]
MPPTRAPRRLVAPLLVCLAFAGVLATMGIAATSLAAGHRKMKASTASSTLRFGLADYEARTFSDPRVRELGVYLARDVVPWNVALVPRELANVREWLDAVKHAYHITPLITFQHASNNDRAPSPAQFLAAFLRFRKLFPWVNEFVPWDEATHATQPTEHRPWLAAEYYNVLAAHCRGCEVTAPDILDSDGDVEAWVAEFLEKAHPYPKIWAFNPYASVSTDNPRLIENFLSATRGQVWFSEVGGVVWWRFKGKLIDHGVEYAARVAKNIFTFAKMSPRITRIYYYHWRSPGTPKSAKKATWDAGLVSSNGAARPALLVVAKELHRHLQRAIPAIF